MESFRWNKYFITGLPEVDKQHRHLVDIINQFGNLLADNEVQMQDVDKLFSELADYAAYHFQDEENLMSQSKLDTRHIDHHVLVHKSFLEDVTSLYSGISQDNIEQASSILEFLMHWLAYHILGQDQDMGRQIKAIESGMSPQEAFEQLEQERARETVPLLEALNGLFELVSQRNRELKQLNESLEEKVALRTKELSVVNQQLEAISLTDVLTGLPNRRHALNLLANLWNENTQIVCMMVDADHFKEVNDDYGHDAGDAVLQELAKTLQQSIRTNDTVCRLGGDEFFIICPDTDEETGLRQAELIRKTVSKLRAPTGGEPWHGSVSIGVAKRLPDMKNYEEVIKLSDLGVYAAKMAGKNCVRLGSKSIN